MSFFEHPFIEVLEADYELSAVWSYSSFFILTAPISEDLDVAFEQQSWVIVRLTFSDRTPSLQDFHTLDILRCDILRLSPLLGPRLRPLLCETGLLLRLHRTRRHESDHLLSTRQILLLHPTCHLWDRGSLSHTSQLPIDRCRF